MIKIITNGKIIYRDKGDEKNTKQSKEDELLDLQLQQQRMAIKSMKRENRDRKIQRVSSAVKRAGSFAARTIAPKQEITREEANNKMFGFPSEMFDTSKAFGNSSSNRGKKVYRRRVR